MDEHHFSGIISDSIRKLSDPETYAMVCHEHRLGEPLPSTQRVKRIVELIREIIFPGFFGSTSLRTGTTRHYMGVYVDELLDLLPGEILAGLCFECKQNGERNVRDQEVIAREATHALIASLPEIRRKMVNDVEAMYMGDPAAGSFGEVIFCYPAIRAITNYRIAHRLVELHVPLIPRYISEMAHSETGIDIHPEASIGEYFAIDHGTGVVIGSTCIIGNHMKLYQGVTLGAKSFELDDQGNPVKGIPRHPIVENHVVIYAGATILGRITIGAHTVVGGNVWVTHSLPPHSKVVQKSPRENSFSGGAGI